MGMARLQLEKEEIAQDVHRTSIFNFLWRTLSYFGLKVRYFSFFNPTCILTSVHLVCFQKLPCGYFAVLSFCFSPVDFYFLQLLRLAASAASVTPDPLSWAYWWNYLSVLTLHFPGLDS